MQVALLVAAGLAVITAVAHSILGERLILIPLFRREDLPRLLGSEWLTKRTLRFTWHLASVAWWGFAALLLLFAADHGSSQHAGLRIIAATALCSSVLTAITTNGRHPGWIAFLVVALLAWFAS
jgi:hypothetical protein